MANIFLSYHKQHQKTAEKLRYALMYRGFTTWFIEDNNVDVPHEEMEKAIENASVVIMCMSTKYQASENCKKEIEYAERLNKPIIPILVESGFTPSGWLAVVSGSKTVIDFGDSWYFFESFEQLQEELAAKNINKEGDNSQTGHIFLSYHNQHRKIAVKLRGALKSRGFKTWFDRDDTDGVPQGEMEKGIEKASVVIMCMSSPYKTSENCRKDIEYAERLKKPIIPIHVECGFEPSGWLELASGSKMVIDFSDEINFNEKFEQLLEELAAKNISIKKKRTGEIFLSYHNEHQNTVMRLRGALKSRGFTTWFDRDDTVGMPNEEIKEGIENASVVIMCMSTKYQASENFKKEIEYAERLQKPIIPILVEFGFTPSGWLTVVSGSKMVIDFSDNWYFFESFEQFQEELAAKNIFPNAVDSRKHRKKMIKFAEEKRKEVGDIGNYANDEDGEDILQYLCHVFLEADTVSA